MNVILLETIGKLGNLGDTVSVKNGYARNYLVPFGKAVPATKANIELFEERRAKLEEADRQRLVAANERALALKDLEVSITVKAGDEGKLFGSVGARDIATAITAAGVPVSKSEVDLPQNNIRQIGQYQVTLHLHNEVDATVTLDIVSE